MNRRFLIAYIALVGVPILLIVLVLHIGNRLAAPVSVDGVWVLSFRTSGIPLADCLSQLASRTTAMLVSQSGRALAIDLRPLLKQPVSAQIQGSALISSPAYPGPAGANACQELLWFRATVQSGPKPQNMTGELHLSRCPGCAPLTFSAIREPAYKEHP